MYCRLTNTGTHTWVDRELALAEMLDDPIVKDMMRSDGVESWRRDLFCRYCERIIISPRRVSGSHLFEDGGCSLAVANRPAARLGLDRSIVRSRRCAVAPARSPVGEGTASPRHE